MRVFWEKDLQLKSKHQREVPERASKKVQREASETPQKFPSNFSFNLCTTSTTQFFCLHTCHTSTLCYWVLHYICTSTHSLSIIDICLTNTFLILYHIWYNNMVYWAMQNTWLHLCQDTVGLEIYIHRLFINIHKGQQNVHRYSLHIHRTIG